MSLALIVSSRSLDSFFSSINETSPKSNAFIICAWADRCSKHLSLAEYFALINRRSINFDNANLIEFSAMPVLFSKSEFLRYFEKFFFHHINYIVRWFK